MSTIIEYYLAASDSEAVSPAVLTTGPSRSGHTSVELRGIDPVVTLATLEEILTGNSAIATIEAGGAETVLSDGKEGVRVFRLRESLVTALVDMEQSLTEIAGRWASTEELRGTPTATLTSSLAALRSLAEQSRVGRLGMYCWMPIAAVDEADTAMRCVVIFTCSRTDGAAIDIVAGPWASDRISRQVLPLDEATTSIGTLEGLQFVYVVVANPTFTRPALKNKRTAGGATLGEVARPFAEGLATLHDDELPASRHRRQHNPKDEIEAISQRWMATQRANLEMSGFRDRLASWRQRARLARERGEPLYCWYGPPLDERT
jgi:hypothetical protein